MRFTLLLALSLLLLPAASSAQTFGGGGSVTPTGPDGPSAEQRAAIWQQLQATRARLTESGVLAPAARQGSAFQLPIAAGDGVDDPGVFAISNFVDLDPTGPDNLLDYTCGARTYDTDSGYDHAGIDYFTWPFGWTKMDTDAVYAVAAADGVIIGKNDGNPDRSCTLNGSNWNAVYLQHADGSTTWYGHLKRNSLLDKPVGASVAAGERLGVIGSSGNSTGPHLHFEVYDSAGSVVEPTAGACNPNVSASWWADQEPYYVPGVSALYTHSAAPQFPQCPSTTEVTNRQDTFRPGDRVFTAAYYRDQLQGQQTEYRVRRPDGTVARQWSHSSSAPHYSASYWYWTLDLPATAAEGLWSFEASFEGETTARAFRVQLPTASESGPSADRHLGLPTPNPFGAQTTLALSVGTAQHVRATATDALGREVAVLYDGPVRAGEVQTLTLDAQGLAPGLYQIWVEGETFREVRRATRVR